jgi:hypothetical protein
MKPYGRKPKHHNYEDKHPPKGYINWWEAELDSLNKKTERQKAQKIINEEIANNTEGKVIRPILAEPCATPEYGDILYASEYISGVDEEINALKSSGINLISLSSPDSWETAKRMNVDTDELKEKVIYECPFFPGNKYFWMAPVAIIVNGDIKQYREPNLSNSFYDYRFDTEFTWHSMGDHSIIKKVMLGHGFTVFTLPSDGDNGLKYLTINLDNGDRLLMLGWIWYNK